MAFECTEVLEPLLRRLQEFAERLARKEEVPWRSVEEGLNLWQSYAERLHDAHIREIAEVGHVSGVPVSGTTELAEIEQDPRRAQARIGEIRAMLASYAGGYRVFSGLMSPAIRGNTLSELAWEKFDEEFLRTWDPPPLPPAVLAELRESLAATRKVAEELRVRVQGFLERTTLPVPGRAPPTEARSVTSPPDLAARAA